MKFLFLVFTLTFSFVSFGAQYSDPTADQILYRIEKAPSLEALPNSLNILVWNVHKGLDGQTWISDFKKLSQGQDLILVQEGTDDSTNKAALFSQSQFGWWMGVAYIENATEVKSGVVTGATSNPLKHSYFLSESKEPVSRTGHTILASTFKLKNEKELLVTNVHGINFVINSKWHKQMSTMETLIIKHQGPGIVAGDFNTWSGGRLKSLDLRLSKYGYKKVALKNDKRRMKLDHVYVKDCSVSNAEILLDVKSSDHLPIKVRLDCK